MTHRETDDLPYRTPVTARMPAPKASVDEVNHSTLLIVRNLLRKSVSALSSDFNAFEVLQHDEKELAAMNLLRQVEVKQGVYDIVAPLLDAIETATKNIDNKHKG